MTGSCNTPDEPLIDTARRRVPEETGIDATQYHPVNWNHHIEYKTHPRWRHRYAPDITRNTEHQFDLLVNGKMLVRMSPREHVRVEWLPYQDATARCFSRSNVEAILQSPERLTTYHARQVALTRDQA